MTQEQIIAAGKPIRERYKEMIYPAGPMAAAKECLTLEKMTRKTTLDDGTQTTCAVAWCYVALETILSSKKVFTLSVELRKQVAALWVQSFPDWTVGDVKLFEFQYLTGLLPSYNLLGKEMKDFITYDIPGIFDKLHAYDKKRPGYVQRQKADRIAGLDGSSQQSSEGKDEYRPRPPIWEIDPFYQTHDWAGQEHPPDWDYKAYWAAKPTSEEVDTYCPNLRPKLHDLFNDKWQTQRTNQETINY